MKMTDNNKSHLHPQECAQTDMRSSVEQEPVVWRED